MVKKLGRDSMLSQRNRYAFYFFVLRYIVPLVLATTSGVAYFLVISMPWIEVNGAVSILVSPSSTYIVYMGYRLVHLGLDAAMDLARYTGFLVIAVNLLLGFTHLPITGHRARASIAYTAIVISFIYSFVIVPNLYNRVLDMLRGLGVLGTNKLSIDAGSGLIVLGVLDIVRYNPHFVAQAAFLFTLASVGYVFWELYSIEASRP